MKKIALLAIVGLAASAAQAQTFSFTGTPVAIPDNVAAGVSINTGAVVGTDAIITAVSVTIAFDPRHTWIGDLIATLTYTPTVGPVTSVSLFNRVGRVATGFGDSSAVLGSYLFADGGADFWAAAAGVGFGVNIPNATYAASGAGSGAALAMDATFAGLSSAGSWSLTVSDLGGGDTGTIASANVSIRTIPSPAAAALLGLGGLVATRRRRLA